MIVLDRLELELLLVGAADQQVVIHQLGGQPGRRFLDLSLAHRVYHREDEQSDGGKTLLAVDGDPGEGIYGFPTTEPKKWLLR